MTSHGRGFIRYASPPPSATGWCRAGGGKRSTTARALLEARLTRRGFALSAALCAAALASGESLAALSSTVIRNALGSAGPRAADAVSTRAAILAEGVIQAMLRRIQAPDQAVNRIAVSPDGKYIVASPTTRDVGNVPVWDLDTGKEVQRLPSLGGPELSALAFSPDGKLLAMACNLDYYAEGRDTIHLYDGKTLKPLGTLRGHLLQIARLQFSAKGDILASGSADGTVLLWDVGSSFPGTDARGN